MYQNAIADSIARQYQQDRRAEAKQHRIQQWLQNLRKVANC
jgi:hypothetical protein